MVMTRYASPLLIATLFAPGCSPGGGDASPGLAGAGGAPIVSASGGAPLAASGGTPTASAGGVPSSGGIVGSSGAGGPSPAPPAAGNAYDPNVKFDWPESEKVGTCK